MSQNHFVATILMNSVCVVAVHTVCNKYGIYQMVVEILYRGYVAMFLSRKKRKRKFHFRNRILDTYTLARFVNSSLSPSVLIQL